MEKNKITTYLLYAIGEIVLVVVGILIAVSIDDWNESVSNRKKEVKYLRGIKLDLEKDIEQLEELILFRQEKKEGSEMLIDQMKGKSQDETEIIYHISNAIYERKFTPNNTTYNELSSSGNLNLIESDSIKVLLLELQNLYQRNQGMVEHETFDYREYVSKELTKYIDLNYLLPIRNREKTAKDMNVSIKHFDAILGSIQFKNGIHIMAGMSDGFIDLYDSIQYKSEKINDLIDLELQKN